MNAVTMADRFPPPEMKITRVGAPALLESPCTRRTALHSFQKTAFYLSAVSGQLVKQRSSGPAIESLGDVAPVVCSSQEEMDTADIPYHYRDYCAHMWVDYKECRVNNPFMWRKNCHHEVCLLMHGGLIMLVASCSRLSQGLMGWA